jgi:hypothetical protein
MGHATIGQRLQREIGTPKFLERIVGVALHLDGCGRLMEWRPNCHSGGSVPTVDKAAA